MQNHSKVKCLIIYQMDPLGNKIGGIETFLKNFIKYSPNDFDIEFVGITSSKKERPVGRWQKIELFGKRVKFFPVMYVRDENTKTKIPLSLKFTISLWRYQARISLKDRILEFHRIEPSIPFKTINNKKILFVHGNMIDLYNPHTEVKWGKLPSLYFQMEKRLITQFNKIFVVREDGVSFYQKKYPLLADKFSFLPTWVDDEIFYPFKNNVEKQTKRLEFIKQNEFSPEDRLVLFVGRLEGQKDPLLLIDTFFYISRHLSKSRLLVVGTGSLRGKMEQRIKQYGINEKVHFFGALPQDKVAEIMRISDVFLLTSAFEGMPLSVLEALGCGLPVASTDAGEVRRVVKNEFSGLVTSERRPDMLGDAVLELLNNKPIFSIENCLSSVKDYKVRSVLQQVFQTHYNLVRQ